MTNGSGPTQPPGPRPHILSGAAEQSARITRLPDALSDVGRALRLEAEVVQQNQDGTTRVRTAQGDIDVQVRGRQPQPGQLLEVDVPAGRPPRQVTIRFTPAPARTPDEPPVQTRTQTAAQNAIPADASVPIKTRPAAQAPQPAPAPTQPPQTQAPAQGTPGRAVAPPSLPPHQAPAAATPPQQQPPPLPPGSVVRFLPVTPAQAQQIVQVTQQMMLTLPTQVTRMAFTAGLIAQNALDTNAQTLMQVKTPDLSALNAAVRQMPLAQQIPVAGTTAPSPAAQLLQQILNLNLPAASAQPTVQTQGTAAAAMALTQQPLPAAGTPVPVSSLITTLPGGENLPVSVSAFARIAQIDARILTIHPPQLTLTAPAREGPQGLPLPGTIKLNPAMNLPQAPAGTLTAQVTGITPQNLPLVTLQWPGSALPQSFILQFNAAGLPVGSQITLQPQNIIITQPGAAGGATAPSPGAVSALPPALVSLFGPGPWPVMDEAYQTLLQISPQVAQALARSLPSPANPAQLGGAALLFIAAVRSGDIGSWLGDRKIDVLQRVGKNNLLSRLTQDLSTLAQRTTDSAASTGEWRAVPLPLFWEGEIHKIALYVKDDSNSANDEKEKGKQTRFIFDLDLNRMGGVQLDGLVRGPRFDLVVRTQTPLSSGMQQAMKQSYHTALQDTDLHGDLSFQGDMKHWVNVLQQDVQFGASA